MDSPPDEAFDRLTRLASKLLRAPVALVSLVDNHRQFFKSAIGLPESWGTDHCSALTYAFCEHIVNTNGALVVNDAANDPIFKNNLAVSGLGVAAYAGIPIKTGGGHTLGSFCVIDVKPRCWTQAELSILNDLAQTAITEVSLREKIAEQDEFLRRFQHWIERMPIGAFICGPDMRISGWNPAAERIFGFKNTQADGRMPHELLFTLQDSADAGKRLEEMALTGKPERSVMRCMTRDGDLRICSWTITTLLEADGSFGGFIAMVEDVTAQTRVDQERAVMESQMRQSEERFRQLAEAIREVFWMTDIGKHRVLYVSPRYEEIWGRSCESLYQTPGSWFDAIHPEDRDRVVKAAREKQALGQYDEEYRIVRPDGGVRWIRDQAFPVNDEGGHVYRIAGVAEDITQRKRLEEQFRQSQKMDAIGQLAGGVAHDFNNILTVIHGNASLLLSTQEKNPEVAEFAHSIVHASERAAGLTRQLLMFSRKQVMHRVNLDLGDVVAQMARMFQRVLGEDIALQVQRAPSLPLVCADGGMIEQVLLNLVVNARDAMHGGGRLLISTGTEEVDAAQASGNPDATPGRCVVLSVIDSGTGISPEALPHIFEPFFTTKESGKGTGLGLATVYGIVKQHRGWIAVQSSPGAGTTFRIYFPAAEGRVEAKAETPQAMSLPRGSETVLIVEDEKAVRDLVCSTLQRCGYTVVSASTGAEAIKLWQEGRHQIQLLVTDVIMPDGVSGPELGLKLLLDNPKLKIIYTSGHAPKLTGNQDALIASENFLQKPYSLQQLATVIRQRLDDKKVEVAHTA